MGDGVAGKGCGCGWWKSVCVGDLRLKEAEGWRGGADAPGGPWAGIGAWDAALLD